MVDPNHPRISIVRQCRLVSIARSSFYYAGPGESPLTLRLMRLIDAQFLETPFYGSRQMTRWLRRQGNTVSRKRVRRLMRLLGVHALYQRTSQPQHRTCCAMPITRPNHVWCTEIPLRRGFHQGVLAARDRRLRAEIFDVRGYSHLGTAGPRVHRRWRHSSTSASTSFSEARSGISWWMDFYNERRPHSALDDRTPQEYTDGEVARSPGLRPVSCQPKA